MQKSTGMLDMTDGDISSVAVSTYLQGGYQDFVATFECGGLFRFIVINFYIICRNLHSFCNDRTKISRGHYSK